MCCSTGESALHTSAYLTRTIVRPSQTAFETCSPISVRPYHRTAPSQRSPIKSPNSRLTCGRRERTKRSHQLRHQHQPASACRHVSLASLLQLLERSSRVVHLSFSFMLSLSAWVLAVFLAGWGCWWWCKEFREAGPVWLRVALNKLLFCNLMRCHWQSFQSRLHRLPLISTPFILFFLHKRLNPFNSYYYDTSFHIFFCKSPLSKRTSCHLVVDVE